ncbi:MAG TPA: DegV family protein [Clostridiales bacterium]|nr:DegV family protein [Clostridiales bacterium]
MTVKVVTDSTCDVPLPRLEELGVTVVPLTVHFGPEQYKDHVEMSPEQFFAHLTSSSHHPRTSQPSPGEFAEVYRRLSADGSSIISIHLSSELSGTYQSAVMGAQMVPEADVEVVDSRLASLAFGIAVVRAARLAKEGKAKEEILRVIRRQMASTHVFLSVDTLEYLRRNGRIGKAQYLLGTLLNFKPILTLEDGVVAPYDRVRGRKKVIPRLVQAATERVPAGSEIGLAIAHGAVPDQAAELREAMGRTFRIHECHQGCIGAVIGTHVGPGTLAVCFYAVDEAREGS